MHRDPLKRPPEDSPPADGVSGARKSVRERRDAQPAGGLSVKGRALKYLAQREHSRLELLRKLGPYAESSDQIERLLDELQQAGLFSQQRFVQSLVLRRAAKFGARRIAHELEQHRIGSDETADELAVLARSERERALSVWRRKFDRHPVDMSERARQHRFLAQRGFSGDTIAWVLKQAGSTEETPE